MTPPGDDIHFYKDSPIIFSFISKNHWVSSESERLSLQRQTTATNFYFDSVVFISICDGDYPLPETISIVKRGVTFTFTPIPVYE